MIQKLKKKRLPNVEDRTLAVRLPRSTGIYSQKIINMDTAIIPPDQKIVINHLNIV